MVLCCDLFEISGSILQYQTGYYVSSSDHATSGTANLNLHGAGNGLVSGTITELDANWHWNVVKGGAGTWTLWAANLYTGDTLVNAGTLSNASAFLPDAADIYLASGAALNLSFTGTPDTIDSLFINNVSQATGLSGAIGSGAAHESALITGTGMLLVSTTTTIPGDYNNDGKVNAADYVLWRKDPNSFGGPGGYATWAALTSAIRPAAVRASMVGPCPSRGRASS